ncbi:hypothetical protein BBO99_00006291 [Phytophthora kernoviae]|uniref:MOCS2A n=2 Tax=Phytophthora kernoviae TaxID=325452 RepID=A0A421GL78_9STRA|nr:hypothetical protein G195_007196 [Phytophthora kernoviae 00238/432]KAG2527000.1 hypothetical protein JM16_002354 [Phytophthora kernoviae]KAG2528510.1 hypothetical protein JM18_003037 [Phytophthora kernoviae]RLN20451.1 hypothetical protein BBI17_006416 [Phytophthora kernoviae]RLN78001.1 hypothetical protein BBO99_00006291 [Phytophthora kernoviae]
MQLLLRIPTFGKHHFIFYVNQQQSTMQIKVLYFASAREEIGLREEKLCLDNNKDITLATLRRVLCEKYPHAAATIDSITLARNLEYSSDDMVLEDGDEVALIPPISGG